MVKFKNLGIILTSTAFTVSLFSPVSQASANEKVASERIEIQVASTDTKVSKSTLIKKIHEIFPGKFDFVKDIDFHIGTGHYFSDDKTIRYDLSFNKTVNGRDIHGSFTFKGDSLELESFYYEPANKEEAMYPAKYSETEAQTIAYDFLKKLPNTAGYKLQEDDFDYYFNSSRPLSEPIRYSFVYAPTHDNIPIANYRISIDVLANGEIASFNRYSDSISQATFDRVDQKKNESDVLAQLRENLSVELRYVIDYDFETGKQFAKLVYVPSSGLNGVHALSGQWQSANGFTSQVPFTKKVEKLSAQPLGPRKNGITIAEAEELAKAMIKTDSNNNAKLEISMVDERENENGETIYSIHYSYSYKNSSVGTSLEIKKATGEVIHYNDISEEYSTSDKEGVKISSEAALTKAIGYLKEYAPSYLHEYSKPIDEVEINEYNDDYNFTFPRIVNGIPVSGDGLMVAIGPDGSLRSLYISSQAIKNWPSPNKTFSNEQAKESYSKALNVQLQYVKQNSKDKKHFNLVYTPIFDDSQFNQIDATTGEWLKPVDESKEKFVISHPTAANELNYLLKQNILDVKDLANFNADQAVTKGEALKILLKSVSYGYFGNGDGEKQSFNNIDKNHPLYGVVEQAVRMGILQPANQFDVDATLTRQELAIWSVIVLQLDNVAKYKDIYKLNFADAASIDPAYTGYIAIASGMGLIDAQQNNFNATKSVSYADLAVSTVRLAKAVQENKGDQNFYY